MYMMCDNIILLVFSVEYDRLLTLNRVWIQYFEETMPAEVRTYFINLFFFVLACTALKGYFFTGGRGGPPRGPSVDFFFKLFFC